MGLINGGSSTGVWSSSTGAGTFVPNSSQLAVDYLLSSADTALGEIDLILTSTNNGSCNAVTDTFELTITDAPFIQPIVGSSVCADTAFVNLTAVDNGVATAYVWESASAGTFDTGIASSYVPSAADTAAGSVLLSISTTAQGSCLPVSENVIITITDAPFIDAGAPISVCASNPQVTLNASSNAAASAWKWSTITGSGSFSSTALLAGSYTPSDADTAAGQVMLYLESTVQGICKPVIDSVLATITNALIVDAGVDDTICANNLSFSLNGTVPSTGIWSSRGDGTFSSDSDMLGTYLAGENDTTAKEVTILLTSTNNGSCAAAVDSMLLTINSGIYVEAGDDETICANSSDVPISGSVNGATTNNGVWSSSGNTGTFDDPTSLATIYHPSAADTTAGGVTLYLTSTDNQSCEPVRDSIVLTINGSIQVTGGGTTTVCANNPTVTLGGNVSGSTNTGIWSTVGGDGTFSDVLTVLNNSYTPGNADTLAGEVDVVLLSTNMGACNVVTDTMHIIITDAPFIQPIVGSSVCADTAFINLTAVDNGVATAYVWESASAGTFDTGIASSYVPSAADTAAGSVLLSISTTAQGSCLPVSENVIITITDAPFIDAGPPISVCASNPQVILNASSNAAASAWKWSTITGSGSFSSTALLAGSYTPSDADTAAGQVMLYLESTVQGICKPVIDSVLATITNALIVDAGVDDTICANNLSFSLNGTVPSTGIWSSRGDGTFSSDTDMLGTYLAGENDTTAKEVTILLTSTNNGSCAAAVDSMLLTINSGIYVEAGDDETICANSSDVPISGSVNGATTNNGVWSSSGNTGTFDDPTSLATIYHPSTADTTAGGVTLYLTSTDNQSCEPVRDSIVLTINGSIQVTGGGTTTVCANNPTVTLGGNVSGSTNTGIWSTVGGDGTFSDVLTVLNNSYTPGNADTLAGEVDVVLLSTNMGACNVVTDTMHIIITDAPFIQPIVGSSVCADTAFINLTAVDNGVATAYVWESASAGTFDTGIASSYVPSAADTTAGSVLLSISTTAQGSCLPVSENVIITITDAPFIDAGPPISVCASNPQVTLNASSNAAASAWKWSTITGSGSFSSTALLAGSYTPSDADTAAGQVMLYLESTVQGICKPVIDSVLATITNALIVDAGVDDTICANNLSFSLNGTVPSTGIWSSRGDGTFSSDIDMLGTYLAGENDTTAKEVTILLTSTNNGSCAAAVDSMLLTINSGIYVEAGDDETICANSSDVPISGSVNGATTNNGVWSSSGNTGTFDDPTSLATIYHPSTADTTAGGVTLYLTSTDNQSCEPVRDSIVLTINGSIQVTGGGTTTVCANNPTVTLGGNVSGSTNTGIWSTVGGDGTFSDVLTVLNNSYTPGNADTLAGEVDVVLLSTNMGACNVVTDTMHIIITDAPFIQPIVGSSVCADTAFINLTAVDNGVATAYVWESASAGTFDTGIASSYVPSAADTAAGSVLLYFYHCSRVLFTSL